jgi:acyl-coenzyme A thioesterase PaaI-like protein
MRITDLPFNAHIGLRLSERDGELLELPAAERNGNHLGSVHASAQMALAEATSGQLLLNTLQSASQVVPVVRRFEGKFRKPAHGTLFASARFAQSDATEIQRQLASKGRAMVEVAVEIHAEDGTHTFSATVEWYLQILPDA